MNNVTYSLKNGEIESKWYIIDAANKPLGRVATEAAKLLRGKHKPTFTPNIDMGDHVIIINAKDVILTGNKLNQKTTCFNHAFRSSSISHGLFDVLESV